MKLLSILVSIFLILNSCHAFRLSIDTGYGYNIKMKFIESFETNCLIKFNTRSERGQVVPHQHRISGRENIHMKMDWLQRGIPHDLCFHESCKLNIKPHCYKFTVPR